MEQERQASGLGPSSFALAGLAMAIGWGIRGNFGHEFGAMLAGVLGSIAVALASGRADWRRRVPYFALFGGVGWAFGGSMSYGQVIAYTHSGHGPSQLYGFAALFAIGFLWALLGGAGAAFAGVASRERLTQLVKPMLAVFILWGAIYFAWPAIEHGLSRVSDPEMRHESLLYWLDADWLAAGSAIVAIALYDVVRRRLRYLHVFAVYLAACAALGAALWYVVRATGLYGALVARLVRYEGDPAEAPAEAMVTNWPEFFRVIPGHVGWIAGAAVGVALFAAIWARRDEGARLILHMAFGWWAGFLALPVLLNIRMTPPRGDNWAGILGVGVFLLVYLWKSGLGPVAWASLVSAFVGGLGFSGAQCLKLALIRPGNPAVVEDVGRISAWSHWQSANWHSVLEQSYGLINGLGLMLALGLLARQAPRHSDDPPRRRWTAVAAIAVALPLVMYVNHIKNVEKWTELRGPSGAFQAVPEHMAAPLIPGAALTSWGWYSLVYLVLAVAIVAVLARHLRRRVEAIPESPLGACQLLFAATLWWAVAGNFERALVGFTDTRLITEGTITLLAALATVLALLGFRRDTSEVLEPAGVEEDARFPAMWRFILTLVLGLLIAAGAVYGEFRAVRALYGDAFAGHAGRHTRFGEAASWRTQPVLKGEQHQ